MTIGELDDRITLHEVYVEKNDWNENVVSYPNFADVWAKVVYRRGSESEENAQLLGRQIVEFTIRYTTQPQTDWRVNYGGSYFNIISVTHIGRKQWTVLTCERRDNQ